VAIFGRAFLSTTGLAHDADWYPLARSCCNSA